MPPTNLDVKPDDLTPGDLVTVLNPDSPHYESLAGRGLMVCALQFPYCLATTLLGRTEKITIDLRNTTLMRLSVSMLHEAERLKLADYRERVAAQTDIGSDLEVTEDDGTD